MITWLNACGSARQVGGDGRGLLGRLFGAVQSLGGRRAQGRFRRTRTETPPRVVEIGSQAVGQWCTHLVDRQEEERFCGWPSTGSP
ncbi:hypothetical protein SVIO_107210 [Streptomyces violaceusniger]|uniref:Uncharacterized protein n=1 Tax=Streptomyces violaceusniger TaxID=68280 RepID=A0A4D4LNT9_STRVO|nr:hypothetical protein SVIO_107210 [Streptomyces violaceusniger]